MNPFFEMVQSVDSAVILWIFQTGGNLCLDQLAIFLNWVGIFRIPAILLGIFLWRKKETRPIAMILLAAVLTSMIVTFLIKELVHRPRPYIMGLTAADMLVQTDPTVSFPSGHTATAFTTATVISYFFRKWMVPALTLALMAGLARIYLIVHYPSDMVAGACVGIFVALAIIYVAKKLQENEKFAFLRPDLKKDG